MFKKPLAFMAVLLMPSFLSVMRHHTYSVIAAISLIFASLVPASAGAASFNLYGYAGDLNAPSQSIGPNSTAIDMTIANSLASPRSSTAYGFVDNGIVRVESRTQVPAGTQSIGDIVSLIRGSWRDTMTFEVPAGVPGIGAGTAGRTTLYVDITGDYSSGGIGQLQQQASVVSRFQASLFKNPDSCVLTAECAAIIEGEREFPLVDPDTDSLLPTTFSETLAFDLDFIWGEEFDIEFKMSARTSIGFEGNAPYDLIAEALLADSAVWGGVGAVEAMLEGQTEWTEIAAENVSLTSSSFDYTDAVSTVPVPAAAWLFGSALIGLVGIKRKK